MNRRELLKHTALLLGAAVSPSVVSAVLSGCRHGAPAAQGSAAWRPQTLSADQDNLVTTLCELIIPATDTPGAREARVNEFVDLMMTRFYAPAERDRFAAGLADVERRSAARAGKAFAAASPDAQTAILTELDAEAQKAMASGAAQKPFFSMLKELTVVGYYTSEIGATIELKYVDMVRRYEGDIPFARAGRTYSL